MAQTGEKLRVVFEKGRDLAKHLFNFGRRNHLASKMGGGEGVAPTPIQGKFNVPCVGGGEDPVVALDTRS